MTPPHYSIMLTLSLQDIKVCLSASHLLDLPFSIMSIDRDEVKFISLNNVWKAGNLSAFSILLEHGQTLKSLQTTTYRESEISGDIRSVYNKSQRKKKPRDEIC